MIFEFGAPCPQSHCDKDCPVYSMCQLVSRYTDQGHSPVCATDKARGSEHCICGLAENHKELW